MHIVWYVQGVSHTQSYTYFEIRYYFMGTPILSKIIQRFYIALYSNIWNVQLFNILPHATILYSLPKHPLFKSTICSIISITRFFKNFTYSKFVYKNYDSILFYCQNYFLNARINHLLAIDPVGYMKFLINYKWMLIGSNKC